MRALVLTAMGLVVGCGPQAKPFHYPLDGELRVNQVQVKATHNSYHVETPGNTLPDWHYTHAPLDVQLDQEGVRSLELDINWEAQTRFQVYHVVSADEGSTCPVFTDCLKTIAAWSARYPGHLPIYIQMEPKTGFRGSPPEVYFAALEKEILSVFPREQLFTPDQLKGTAPTLRDAVRQNGWPTLGAMRGKIFFAFNDTGDVRMQYTRGGADLSGRLIFVESSPDDPLAAVAILNNPVSDGTEIRAALQGNMLVRTMADPDLAAIEAGDVTLRDAALASGAHVVSTDHPVPVAGIDYAVTIPGGTPSRCNPITAPADCTSLAVEDPAFVGSAGR